MSLFGNTSNTSSNIFGTTQPQAGPSAGGNPLFGNTTPASGSLLAIGPGSTQATGTGGGGLFGSSTTQPPGGGGSLFGNATQSTGANATPAGSTLFGSTSTNTLGTTNPTGGLFGNTTNTAPTTGGLFGNASNTPSSTGGLFGNVSSTSSTTGSGLFGTTNPTSTTTGGGLFGAPSQAGTSTSLFGGATQQQAPGSSFFSQPPQQSTGNLFGSLGRPPATGGGGLFGGSILGGSSLLGSTPSNLFSTKGSISPNQQQADAQSQFLALAQRMEGIANAWNPLSPQCRFQHYFYNLVDPNQVSYYGRPANATNETLWQKAVRENPDPSCFVPVLATGFDDLQKRVEAQSQQAAAHQEKLKELQTRIAALAQRHQLSNASRLHRASALQTQLTHRVLKLVQHLHLLIPALRSSAIRPEEEALRAALEEIDEEIRRPGGTGRMRGKLNELWALVGAVNAVRERDRKGGAVEWAVVDEEGLAKLLRYFSAMCNGDRAV
ncbi:Nucleoporin nup44 [Grifola frondosa]|uniref:Nucleoporin nup44 n=1 Tax=Grifola frondosa TaxID=5627 RepID=A0A1C7MHP4_GRIFR|nr:Nucleoporin nup44 [Grifola frondosa]